MLTRVLVAIVCLPLALQAQTTPSPRNASYTMQVTLDAENKMLDGRSAIEWRNLTEAPASDLQFHLYYNAWRDSKSSWMRERALGGGSQEVKKEDSGWLDVKSIKLNGADVTASKKFIAPDDGNRGDQTVMQVPLSEPAASGQTVKIEIEWQSKIPRTFARTGFRGNYFFIAQWFPKLGVWEANGTQGRWNCHQFHSATEFFSDYGVYDVQITVPSNFVVGATGLRLGKTGANGKSTHRYFQEDVHDFAWTASPEYIEKTARFEHPNLKAVDIRLLLMPDHESQADRHFAATRATLEHYGSWYGAYPYGHITVIDPAYGSGAGGMEYPTLFTAGSRWLNPEGGGSPEGVTVHEAGHQFWYGIVGNNEFENAWMDEGFNTFSTARTMDVTFGENAYVRRYFKGFIPWMFPEIRQHRITAGNRIDGYRAAATADAQSKPTYTYFPESASAITYNKTALWLNTLERMLGWETVQKIMSAHFDRWKFRHPKPDDYFAIVNEVSGKDMTWFFDQVHRSSNRFDYGIDAIRTNPDRSSVIVRRYGEGIFPVDVEVVFDNGRKVTERWDGRDRWIAYNYDGDSKIRRATVDPNHILLLDVNYSNNSRLREPQNVFPARKWASKWMVWLQDLMAAFSFFV